MSKWPVPISNLNTGTALVVPEVGDDATIKHLKRPALLFQKIAVFHLSGLTALLDKASSNADLQLKTELEWLLNEGVVVPFATEFFVDHFQEAADHFPEIPLMTSARRGQWCVPDAIDQANTMSYCQIPWLNLPKWIGADGVLVCARTPRFLEPAEPAAHAAYPNVLDIVLDAFPEPDENTPWDQIVEFRSDPDTANQVLALKRWMSKVAQQNITAAEISQEIEWLTHV